MSAVAPPLPTPERIRRLVGLARPQMLRALARPAKLPVDPRVLDLSDAEQAPAVLTRALEMERFYTAYAAAVIAAIRSEAKNAAITIDGKPFLTSRQAARALGVGEFHLANMRDRGKIPAQRAGRNYAFAAEDLIAIVKKPAKSGGYHSPLAGAFLERFKEATRETD